VGGAALPHLLPHLDDLPPSARGRIAMTLAPVARRMKLGDEAELQTPERAVPFWGRFWADRSVDFTEPAVKRSVQRLATRESDLLEQDIRLVDTFALEQLIVAMTQTDDPVVLARLTKMASYVTERDAIVAPTRTRAEVHAVISQWLSWWYVHQADYVVLQGGEKVTASIAQTRYAKWVLGAITGQLGLSTRDGLPIFDKLLARAPVTLGIALLALLVSGAVGVPIGAIAAWRRGRTVDHLANAILLLVYSVPTFLVAQLLVAFGEGTAALVLPVLSLSLLSVAAIAQQQRASLIDTLAQDYVRTAKAKGARTLRVLVVHAIRNALVPTVTIAGVQFPALVGGAFVVEEVFDIHGLGWETLRAIESHDAAWIVAVTLLCAVVTTACLVASDVGYGLLDPRVRERQTGRRTA
jgi:ABC-type dipeptide/oligopeptide/nickel transport system permease component